MSIAERLDRIFPLMHQASEIALHYYGNTPSSYKADGSVVTQADKAIEALLVEGIKKRFPNETIVGEERGTNCGSVEYIWSIDPIDGTAAYQSRLPHWGISVGLFRHNEPVLGVVFMPALGENYWAAKGAGAWMQSERWGRQRLSVTQETDVTYNSLIMVSSHFHCQYHPLEFPGMLRSLGSTVSQVIMVARGNAIGTVSKAYQWDYAGCIPILLEAGGVISNLDGGVPDLVHRLPENAPLSHLIMCAPQYRNLLSSIRPKK